MEYLTGIGRILNIAQENALLQEVLHIIAASFVIGNRVFYYVCLLPEMTATQVTVDKNILFIFAIIVFKHVTHLRYTK